MGFLRPTPPRVSRHLSKSTLAKTYSSIRSTKLKLIQEPEGPQLSEKRFQIISNPLRNWCCNFFMNLSSPIVIGLSYEKTLSISDPKHAQINK